MSLYEKNSHGIRVVNQKNWEMVSEHKNINKDGVAGSRNIKTPINDLVSPFFLLSVDHTGIFITHIILKGDNYDEWYKVVRNTFRAKKKLGFIDG